MIYSLVAFQLGGIEDATMQQIADLCVGEALGILFQFCQFTFGYHGIGTMSFHP